MKKKVKDENMDINPYEVDKLSKVPSWLKLLLLKYWAAAAASFLLFGVAELGMKVYDDTLEGAARVSIQLVVMLGLFLAILMNYVLRPMTRLMYNRRDNTYRYNLINFKGLKSFLVALVYNLAISILICIIIVDVLSPHGLVFDPFGTTGGIGIEPFTVGFIYLFIDGIVLIIKGLIIRIYQRSKYNKQLNAEIKIDFTAGEQNEI